MDIRAKGLTLKEVFDLINDLRQELRERAEAHEEISSAIADGGAKVPPQTCRTCARIVNNRYCLIRNVMGGGRDEDTCSRWECSECHGAGLAQVMHYDANGSTGPEVEDCPRGCPVTTEQQAVLALGTQIGFGRLMQVAEQMWADPGSTPGRSTKEDRMGSNRCLTFELGAPEEVECPKCGATVPTPFEDYDIECGNPNPANGVWVLSMQCSEDDCEHEFSVVLELDECQWAVQDEPADDVIASIVEDS